MSRQTPHHSPSLPIAAPTTRTSLLFLRLSPFTQSSLDTLWTVWLGLGIMRRMGAPRLTALKNTVVQAVKDVVQLARLSKNMDLSGQYRGISHLDPKLRPSSRPSGIWRQHDNRKLRTNFNSACPHVAAQPCRSR